MITELDALKAYAEMMNTRDTKGIAPLLSPALRYNSQWVFEEMVGGDRYCEYMQAKFAKMDESGSFPYAEIGELDEYPFGNCVIMAQGEKDNLIATVLVKVEGDRISAIDICAVPDPQRARRTGEYPGMAT